MNYRVLQGPELGTGAFREIRSLKPNAIKLRLWRAVLVYVMGVDYFVNCKSGH